MNVFKTSKEKASEFIKKYPDVAYCNEPYTIDLIKCADILRNLNFYSEQKLKSFGLTNFKKDFESLDDKREEKLKRILDEV